MDKKKEKGILGSNRGLAVVEILLIVVIILALIILFKTQITQLLTKAFQSINTDSDQIIGNAGFFIF